MGSHHSKVKYLCLLGAKGRLNKAFVSSRIKYHFRSGGNELSKV